MNRFYKYVLVIALSLQQAYGDWHDDLKESIEQGAVLTDATIDQARAERAGETEIAFVRQLKQLQEAVAQTGIDGKAVQHELEKLWDASVQANLGPWTFEASTAIVKTHMLQLAKKMNGAELARLLQEEPDLKPYIQDAIAHVATNQPAQLLTLLENPVLAPLIRTRDIQERFVHAIENLVEQVNEKRELNNAESLSVKAQFVDEFITPEQAAPIYRRANARREELAARERAETEAREFARVGKMEAQDLARKKEAELAKQRRAEAAPAKPVHVAGPAAPIGTGVEANRCADQPTAIVQDDLEKAVENKTLWLPNKAEMAQTCELLQKQRSPASWDKCTTTLLEQKPFPEEEESFDIGKRIRRVLAKKTNSPITGESIEELVNALGTAYAEYPLCEILRKCELKCKVMYDREELEAELAPEEKLQYLLKDWEYKAITQTEDWNAFAENHQLPDTNTLLRQMNEPITTAKLIAARLYGFIRAIEQDPKLARARATSEPGVLALIARTMFMEAGKEETGAAAKPKARMGWCDCIPPVPRLASIIQMTRIIQKNHPDKTLPLRLVSIASGKLLHEYLLTKLLVQLGYREIEFHLVDPKLEADTFLAIKKEFENDRGVTFVRNNEASALRGQLAGKEKQIDGVMIIDVDCQFPFTPDAYHIFAQYARPGGFLYEILKDKSLKKTLYRITIKE